MLSQKHRRYYYKLIRDLVPFGMTSYHPDPTKGTGGHDTQSARRAWELAKSCVKAENLGLVVSWRDEDEPWDGDCPAPKYCLLAFVHKEDNERVWYASLGMIGVNSLRDPYLKLCEFELLHEAISWMESDEGEIGRSTRATLQKKC